MGETSSKPMIGLAGGIGAGKSQVADILAELGCVVARSDEAARAALADPEIRATLVQWWGQGILDEAGEVDRREVAAIVFTNADERRRLEALTHPWIERRRIALFQAAPAETPAFVIDAPLLFEAGLDKLCDAVIFVEASEAIRLARLRKTRGWDEADLRRREDSQLPLDEKRQRADYVIRNDGDLGQLATRVRRILNETLSSRRS